MDSCKSKIVTIEVSVHGLPDGCIQVPLPNPDPRGAIEDPAADLPRYLALRGPNGKYLGYVRDHRYQGFLSFRYDDLASPCVKQEVVKAENGEAHIKCCYNDKFWRKNSPQEEWIVPAADSPNADRSSWSSTLFRANNSESQAGKISLLSLQGNGRGKQLGVQEGEGNAYKSSNLEIEGCLFASGEAEANLRQNGVAMAFEAVSLVKLPRYVAFKGDNNEYLEGHDVDGYPHISFTSLDIGARWVGDEVVEVGDSQGHVWIKNMRYNQFWEISPQNRWVLAYAKVISNNDMRIQFLPVQVDDSTVALRCRTGDLEFCRRYTEGNKYSCIRAWARSLEKSAIFKVEECVKSRRFTSIVYDMSSAHIYDLQPLVLANATAANTSNQSATLDMLFSYTDTKSQSWSNSVSFTTGISFEFSAGVPMVAGTSVTLSTEISEGHQWGKASEQSTNVSATYGVTVAPGERVSVDLVATRGKCNVQFSYIQQDLLTSGETKLFKRTDGVFKGINYTDIQYVAKVVKPTNQATAKTIMSSL